MGLFPQFAYIQIMSARHHFHGLLLLLTIAQCEQISAQTPVIDSIKSKLRSATISSEQLKQTLALCEEHQSLNRDTLYYYALQAGEMAAATGDKRSQDLAALAMANTHLRWGWMDSSIVIVNGILATNPVSQASTRDIYFKASRLKALCYGGRSDFKTALEILYKTISDAELYNDSLAMGANMNTIGSISLARENTSEGMEWFFKALMVTPESPQYFTNRAAIYVNLANAYNQLGKNDSAEYYINKGLYLGRQIQNLNILANALRVQSNILSRQKDFAAAGKALEEMNEVRSRTNNNSNMLVDDNLQLINFYLETGQVDKAIRLCKDRLVEGNLYDTANGGVTLSNNINIRLVYYEALAKCYKAIGDHAGYQQILKQIIEAKDSFYQLNSAEAIAEMQTKYAVQKKENTIILQELNITRKNYLLYGVTSLLALVVIFLITLFLGYRRRQRLKMEWLMKEKKKAAEEAVSRAEENERIRIAVDLHEHLGAYVSSIDLSLDRLSVDSLLDHNETPLQQLRANSSAIVSELSDTIWALKKDALSLTAISDRIKLFIQRLQPSYPGITIDVKENIADDQMLSPSQAFDLFRIVQEAVSNALKHSQGSYVVVGIESTGTWQVTISDNGKGIDNKSTSKTTGNGLSHMMARAKAEGWLVEWHSSGLGTTVVVQAEGYKP